MSNARLSLAGLVALGAALVGAPSAGAAVGLVPTLESPIGGVGAPTHVAHGNFDGDTRVDLAVLDSTAETVTIWRGSQFGRFTERQLAHRRQRSRWDRRRRVQRRHRSRPCGDQQVRRDGLAVHRHWCELGDLRQRNRAHGDHAAGRDRLRRVQRRHGRGVGRRQRDRRHDHDPDRHRGGGPRRSARARSPSERGTNPRGLAIGKFNGDSDPDLAVGNITSDDIRILTGGSGVSLQLGARAHQLSARGPHLPGRRRHRRRRLHGTGRRPLVVERDLGLRHQHVAHVRRAALVHELVLVERGRATRSRWRRRP